MTFCPREPFWMRIRILMSKLPLIGRWFMIEIPKYTILRVPNINAVWPNLSGILTSNPMKFAFSLRELPEKLLEGMPVYHCQLGIGIVASSSTGVTDNGVETVKALFLGYSPCYSVRVTHLRLVVVDFQALSHFITYCLGEEDTKDLYGLAPTENCYAPSDVGREKSCNISGQ